MIKPKQINHFRSDYMMEWIETMASFGPRRAGSPANHQTEEFIIQLLQGFGVENVHKEPIQAR